jgi:hypothetical protein
VAEHGTVAVIGAGAVGARVARALLADDVVTRISIDEPDRERRAKVLESFTDERVDDGTGSRLRDLHPDVVVLAQPSGDHVARAEEALQLGAHVISTTDDVGEVRALLAMDQVARRAQRSLVVGAAFSPGLSCLLAVHAAVELRHVDEVHVARVGVGGAACLRQQQRALHALSVDWRDGEWVERPGGAGRELCYFPDPIGGVDCFRAARPEAMLLVPLFPTANRVTARLGTAEPNPLRARLARKGPLEGPPGAIRVEVRGSDDDGYRSVVLGCMDRASVAASAICRVATVAALGGEVKRHGAGGAAEMLDALPALQRLAEAGVRCARFEGLAT